jgi:hypothetical protein
MPYSPINVPKMHRIVYHRAEPAPLRTQWDQRPRRARLGKEGSLGDPGRRLLPLAAGGPDTSGEVGSRAGLGTRCVGNAVRRRSRRRGSCRRRCIDQSARGKATPCVDPLPIPSPLSLFHARALTCCLPVRVNHTFCEPVAGTRVCAASTFTLPIILHLQGHSLRRSEIRSANQWRKVSQRMGVW